MAQVNLSDYKNLYTETLKKSINSLNAQCDRLKGNALDKEAVNNMYIAAHSLRGRSQVMGHANIANLAKNIEKISSDTLQGITQLNNEVILSIRKKVGKLDEMLRQVQHDNRSKI